nr:protein argonaute 2 [Ipomoea batatas]
MEVEAVPPPITNRGPIGGTEGGARTVKRFKHLKRSFVEVVADCPSFEDEVPVQAEESNWFEDGILIDSDKEDKPSEGYSDIPVVRFSKKVREKRIKLWRLRGLATHKPTRKINILVNHFSVAFNPNCTIFHYDVDIKKVQVKNEPTKKTI